MDLDALIDDLADEHAALAGVLRDLRDHAWDLPTHAPGWAVRDQVAHLASTDEAATQAIIDPAAFRAGVERHLEDPEEVVPPFLERGRALSPGGLLAWWQEASGGLIASCRGLDPRAAAVVWPGHERRLVPASGLPLVLTYLVWVPDR